ncbi:hydrogenase expression protein HypA, partial [Streptomyces sp. NPDC058632]|uniref:hydrogenase expression protein HypA n=2 Tax=unclassified Streptomyces TaxID=2593676 RepID=UPI0036630743
AGTAAALGAQPQARAQAAPEAEGSARGMAAAGGAAGAAGAAAAGGAGEPPSGKPKKPLLAAAGIAGVVLLAVPLLIWATDDGRTKKDNVEVAAGSDTLLDEEPLDIPKGAYAPAEPSPEPSAKKPKAEPTPVVKAPVPVLTSAPPREPVEKKETGKTAEPVKKTKTAETEKVVENPPPKLPANTAGAAVQRLAASNPGRHICYRAFVKDVGWQTPRCDGAVAGVKGKSIKALNIAVSGTKGLSANEFIQKDGWTTEWEGAANGIDLVLGSSSQGAPNLSGFIIDVGEGHVCQNHRVGGHGWGGLACDTVDPWIFGGSTEPHLWLEVVRLTV